MDEFIQDMQVPKRDPLRHQKINGPKLGWSFSNTAPAAGQQAAEQFAHGFLEYLGRGESATVLISGKGTRTPITESVIPFSDHGAVYTPASFGLSHAGAQS
ncbi:hypothetical protein [Streptomyces sp. NPDC053560]|uniref:hypothetical protein n=1 Tax=Streptomyces sp. NPDC053560 TaxID=3365711 RepID=UPI0037D67F3E